MSSDIKYNVNAGFFDAINEDRTYSADDMNRPYRRLVSNGVFATPKGEASDDLQVFSANNGMNVIVSAGNAIIGDKWFENPSDLIITISQNLDILPRIDSIVAQIDKTQAGRIGNIIYRQGSASSNPVHPEINVEENIFELRLADIIISPSCVKITQDLITDCRGSDECPWITSLINQVDTSTLFIQWQTAFNTWFDGIKNQLTEEEAFNLQTQIDKINQKLTETKTTFTTAGAHNSIYRGKDITNLFYDGTLSDQIAAGTFDDIFVGDYIIGKNSNRKYLVADLDYRLHCGDTECTTHHILMIPEKVMGTAKMNDTNITTGAYIGSKMYTEYLEPFKTVIKNDFETSHILTHREFFQNAVKNGYSSGGTWYDSDIDLMNECMVYGAYIFAPKTHNQGSTNTTVPNLYTIDKSQLSLFRHRADLIVAFNDSGTRNTWWLRDVVSASHFAYVNSNGLAFSHSALNVLGVRPAFLIY